MSSSVPDPERALAGAVLLAETPEEAARLIASAGELEARHFRHSGAAAVWRAAGELVQAGRLPDPVSVAAALAGMNGRGNPGAFVGSLLDGLPHVHDLAQWAQMIRDKAPDPDAPDTEREAPGPAPAIAESLHAFMARVRKMPEPGWLVRDLIPDEGVCVWHGRPRSMKSLTAADTMLSLTLGERHALGNPRFAIERAVGCLWLGEEDSERLDAFRLGLMLKARGILPGQEPDTFRLVVRPGWDLESPAGQAELLATIRETSTAMTTPLLVLVIDPIRASMPSIDGGPKDAARARAFLLTILRETSIRVILLPHHDTKPAFDRKDERSRAERASGGVTFSMGDCMVNFERLTDRECLAVPTSYKFSADPDPFRVRFESETPPGQGFRGFLRAVAETTDEATDIRTKVLAYVKANPWKTTGEVDKAVHVATGEASRYLSELEAAGFVVRATGTEAKIKGRSFNACLWGLP